MCVDLLDAGLHADHRAGHDGGAHLRLEVDDPPLRHPQRRAPLPVLGEALIRSSPLWRPYFVQTHYGPIPFLPLTPSPYPFNRRGRGKGEG